MTGTVNAYVAEVVKFARYDYHKCAQLSLLYLDAREDKVSFHHPDAFHKCRWIAKVIYGLKTALNDNGN